MRLPGSRHKRAREHPSGRVGVRPGTYTPLQSPGFGSSARLRPLRSLHSDRIWNIKSRKWISRGFCNYNSFVYRCLPILEGLALSIVAGVLVLSTRREREFRTTWVVNLIVANLRFQIPIVAANRQLRAGNLQPIVTAYIGKYGILLVSNKQSITACFIEVISPSWRWQDFLPCRD